MFPLIPSFLTRNVNRQQFFFSLYSILKRNQRAQISHSIHVKTLFFYYFKIRVKEKVENLAKIVFVKWIISIFFFVILKRQQVAFSKIFTKKFANDKNNKEKKHLRRNTYSEHRARDKLRQTTKKKKNKTGKNAFERWLQSLIRGFYSIIHKFFWVFIWFFFCFWENGIQKHSFIHSVMLNEWEKNINKKKKKWQFK